MGRVRFGERRGGGAQGNQATGYGGAVANLGVLTLNDVDFNSSLATTGGALYNTGTVTMWGADFRNSTATGFGGAIYNTGNLSGSGSWSNSSASHGGAIFNAGNIGTLESGNVTGGLDGNISASTATIGGAIYNDVNGIFGYTGFVNVNTATTGGGGAVFNQNKFTQRSGGAQFNKAATSGGAYYNNGETHKLNVVLTLQSLTVSNNTAGAYGESGKIDAASISSVTSPASS